MTEEGKEQRFETLVENFDNAMFITQALNGELRARPMVIAKHHEDGALYFATSKSSGKTNELEAHPDVVVTMQNSNQYLSVSGHAKEVYDRELIESFFNPMWKLWFPEGKDDPDLILIKVEPKDGEYWDMGKTLNKAKFIFQAGKAFTKGEAIDAEKLSGHGKVDLG